MLEVAAGWHGCVHTGMLDPAACVRRVCVWPVYDLWWLRLLGEPTCHKDETRGCRVVAQKLRVRERHEAPVDACGATLRTAQWANASFNRNMLVH